MNVLKQLRFAHRIRWQSRKFFARARAAVGNGSFVWRTRDGVRFLYLEDDTFSENLYIVGGHESAELAWCEQWLGHTPSNVLDCGANIGWFSAFLAQRLPNVRCLAIEGNALVACRCLRVISQLNLERRIEVLNLVLSESDEDRFVVPNLKGKEAWQSARPASTADAKIPNRSLDSLLSQRQFKPVLIKLDCEGFEPRILRGAARTLAAQSSAWMIECNDEALRHAGSDRAALVGKLRSLGYDCFHLASFDRNELFGVEVSDDFLSKSFNFAAIPASGPLAERWIRTRDKILGT